MYLLKKDLNNVSERKLPIWQSYIFFLSVFLKYGMKIFNNTGLPTCCIYCGFCVESYKYDSSNRDFTASSEIPVSILVGNLILFQFLFLRLGSHGTV
jgi:hypothetical protein